MASNTPDAYQQALDQLGAAITAYQSDPNVQNLVAFYQAQNAVRQASYTREAEALKTQGVTPQTLKDAKLKLGGSGEVVSGMYLGYAQTLLGQLRQALASGGKTPEQTAKLTEAYNAAEQYVQNATARIEQEDQQFADQYSGMTGQPPPPGQFSNAQTIGQTPTPSPSTGVPDEGQRPQMGMGGPATMGPQLPNSPAWNPKERAPKRTRSNRGGLTPQEAQGIFIEPLPDYAPWQAKQDLSSLGQSNLGPVGQDVTPGQPGQPVSADSVEAAQRAAMNSVIPQGEKTGQFKPGYWYGGNKAAVNSGALVFTGYQTRSSKYIDETNPRFGSQIISTKTPTYQSTAGLTYALGKQGFPSIAAYQKLMGLPVTDRLDPGTMDKWNTTISIAAMNTAGGYPTTVQDAIALQVKIANDLAARQRAAMAASYKVDPTASAAILGSAMKQITGRLSNSSEDSEFHRAFNSANISTQGKVDAQQFARDWVRNKYPTEAGTMAGQDYYGAMYDVLTAGPGSLGSQAADING